MKADNKQNPFIDPQGYRKYIASFEKLFKNQLERERLGK
jgi:hypothetical protein